MRIRPLLAALWLTTAAFVAPASAATSTPAAPSVESRPRAPNDASEYRRFTLVNGLQVILLSDPKLNVSSASLAVGVGSLSDPPQRQGLAHFLEHMLFLGTKKYPDVSDFGAYLSNNGGSNNAYTARDRTNYHFEIRHEAFEGALDRFAQFFVAPLFAAQFTEREMNAVNSENQKNLENDGWREYALRNNAYREGHPARKFGTGNRETLGGTKREELLAFYNRYYSANRMTLAITGKASLDQLEQWARSRFGAVPNRKLAELRYPPDYLPPKPALRMLRMEPVKDLRHLGLSFPLPDLRRYVQSKPTELVASVVGGEGAGSLLSQLKVEGLATGLSAGAEADTPDYGSFDMEVSLTPAGLERRQRVLELVFAAIAKLKREGLPAHLFKERQALARLDELYRDKGEGTGRATQLSNAVMDHGLAIAERVPYLWTREDPAAVSTVLGALRPDNLLVTLVAKGVATDKTAPWYGTRYGYSEDTGPAYTALLNPPTVAGLTFAPPNPYVPARTALLPPQAAKIIDEPALTLFYAQDTEFQRPMLAHVLRLRLPRDQASLRTAVLLRFYEAAVKEALNESLYAAGEAGLRFNIAAALEGVTLSVDGYDESAGRLLDVAAAGLIDIQLSDERFAALKERMLRELAAFEKGDAYLTLRETRRRTLREFYYRPDEQLPVARDVTLAQVREFARQLYARGKIEALSYGNVSASDAEAAVRRVAARLKTQPVPDADLLRLRLLANAPGQAVRTNEKLQVNNSALRREYVLGGDAPEMRAATLVLGNFVAEPFSVELRTRQQLGYIVGGGTGEEGRNGFAFFIIQSGEYPADVLEARADAFLQTLPAKLAALPEAEWKTLVAGVRSLLEEKDKSVVERAARLFDLAYERRGDWGRREATLAALDTLTSKRAADILAQAFAPASARTRTFLGFARQHEAKTEPAVTFTDPAPWKAKQRYEP